MNKEFNEGLTAKLNDAGFTEQEQIVGAVTGEFRAGMALLHAANSRGQILMASLALSSTFAKALSYIANSVEPKLDARRIIAASEMISAACEAQARKLDAAAEQSDAPTVRVPPILDTSPAASAKDIN